MVSIFRSFFIFAPIFGEMIEFDEHDFSDRLKSPTSTYFQNFQLDTSKGKMFVIGRWHALTNEAVSGCSPYIFCRLQIVWKNTREVILWEDTSSKLGYQSKGILDYHVFQASSSNTLSQGCKAPWLWRWAWNAWGCFCCARATNGIPTFRVGANTTFGIFCGFNISGSHSTKKVVLQACLPLSATHHSSFPEIVCGPLMSWQSQICQDYLVCLGDVPIQEEQGGPTSSNYRIYISIYIDIYRMSIQYVPYKYRIKL